MSPAPSVRARRQLAPRLVDVLLALIVALPTVGIAIAYAIDHHRPLIVLVAAIEVAALLVRRRRPLVALAIVLAAGLALPPGVPFEFAAVVAIYTLAAGRGWEPAAIGAAAAVVVRVAEVLLWGRDLGTGELLSVAIECAAAVAYGLYRGGRRIAMSALVERAELMDRERELLAARAVAEERVRIAQELHDVVAHTVSLIVVQAQALGATAGSERVTAATDGIADLGRQAMAEMHRTLDLLRAGEGDGAGDDVASARAPQPGLAGLEPLVAQSRAAGLDVTLSIEGAPRELPQTLDLSAYRIVQEALTNVLKHAGATDARVTVAYGPDALALTIADGGGDAPARVNGAPGGHGLVGMRERVALFGGTLDARPRPERGFEVDAVLPYPRP